MAPLKFEEHIKEKLDKREIQPSLRAWDEIASKLNTQPRKRQKNLVWYAVAASFIGILVVSLFYFNNNGTFNEVAPALVDSENKEVPQTNSRTVQEEAPNNAIVVSSEKGNEKETFPAAALEGDVKSPKGTELLIGEELNSGNEKIVASTDAEEVLNAKIAEVIAIVDQLNSSNHAVTDNEIDSLLRQAQRDILRDKLLGEEKTVSAIALLSEVEDELDMSFRDQIFESLKNGYFKVRTAVADRNK